MASFPSFSGYIPSAPRATPDNPGISYADHTRNIIATEAPLLSWEKFINGFFRWNSGEHVGLIGPTGQGKTTLLTELLPLHKYVALFATKPRDKSMDELIKRGYIKLDRWRSLDAEEYPKRVIWPDASRMDSEDTQKAIFGDAFARIYREGNWVLALDELAWIDGVLGLRKPIVTYLLQGRSLDLSLLAAMQRPAWVPREIYTSCTHLFLYRFNDETDLNSLSGIGWRSGRLIREVVSNLSQFQVLYINTRTGKMARTTVRK